MEDTIQVKHNNKMVLVVLGEHAVEMTRPEAEQLLFDLAHALQDIHNIEKGKQDGKSSS